ncbi:hypothetical protein [Flavobacterium wongokense]|uniref:hypothetical protein n=1 Tax=Flavobacterium wongokense TaxID=2910674 RepID=UPI001F1D824E|nr:hypothetical protein [Flavobacterium sp. WG47]MCF6131205.1 hypothetical protein [Flavobacterium sp. WG47]
MKKVFLFASAIALTLSLNSCSKDSGGGSSASMKVDGTNKSFKTIAYSLGGSTYVHGYIGNIETPTETIDFDVDPGTGDKVSSFTYEIDGGDFYTPTTFTSNVTTNSASSAKGSFSGTLEPFGAGANKVITDGKFSCSVTTGE